MELLKKVKIFCLPISTQQSKECWICLGSDDNLKCHCNCPNRYVHEKCLAEWRFRSFGKSEEKQCRFCNYSYTSKWDQLLFKDYKLDKIIPIIEVQYKNIKKNIKITCSGSSIYFEILNNLDIKNNDNISFKINIKQKNNKKIAFNLHSNIITDDLMNYIILCAKLSKLSR